MNDNKIFWSINKTFYCDRLKTEQSTINYIGFGNSFQNVIMILISFFGIFINLYFFISSIRKIIKSKKSNNINLSSIEKILCVISLTETCISICWLINFFAMKTTEEASNHCFSCIILGYFELFFYVFDWMVLSSTLFQIKKILTNPLDNLKTEKYIIKYIIFCAFFGLINVIVGLFADVGGVSPMLTCFIDVVGWEYKEKEKVIRYIFYILFFFIPICILLYGIYQAYSIIKLPEYKNHKKNRKFFRDYLKYIFAYIILALLLISVYVFDYLIGQKVPEGVSRAYVNIVTNLSCSTPFIVGLFRVFKAKLIKKLFLCNKKRRNDNIDYIKDELMINEKERKSVADDYNYEQFEQDSVCKEFKKIFIGISYILDKVKEDENEEEEEKEKEENGKEDININFKDNKNIKNEIDEDKDNFYIINKKEILKDFDLDINEDIFVLHQDEINIEATEYIPTFFKNIRKIENLKESQLARFFKPKNVTPDLFKRTSDSNYYINSLNKQYILKSIRLDQIEYYRKKLKKGKIDDYFEKNKDSIINRVYGLFYLKIDNDKNYYLALMENIYESINQDSFPQKKELKINDNYNDNYRNTDLPNFSKLSNIKIEKKMSIMEYEIKDRIIKKGEENNLEMSFRSRKRTILRKETAFERKFRIILEENEYNRLTQIIEKDIEFLHSVGTNRVKFFIIEKSVESEIWDNLFCNIEDIQERNAPPSIKKYIFKSTKDNIIYCISIVGYFNNSQ